MRLLCPRISSVSLSKPSLSALTDFSNRWLIANGRENEAKAILEQLHSDKSDPDHTFANTEFYQIQKQLYIDQTLGNSWMHIFRKPSNRKRAYIGCGMTFFIQSSGDLVINSKFSNLSDMDSAILISL